MASSSQDYRLNYPAFEDATAPDMTQSVVYQDDLPQSKAEEHIDYKLIIPAGYYDNIQPPTILEAIPIYAPPQQYYPPPPPPVQQVQFYAPSVQSNQQSNFYRTIVPRKKWLLQADLATGQIKRERVGGKFVAADGTVCSLMNDGDLAVVGAYKYYIIKRDNTLEEIETPNQYFPQRKWPGVCTVGKSIYVFGGFIPVQRRFTGSSIVYEDGHWQPLQDLPIDMGLLSAVYTNNQIVVGGGQTNNRNILSSIFIYNMQGSYYRINIGQAQGFGPRPTLIFANSHYIYYLNKDVCTTYQYDGVEVRRDVINKVSYGCFNTPVEYDGCFYTTQKSRMKSKNKKLRSRGKITLYKFDTRDYTAKNILRGRGFCSIF